MGQNIQGVGDPGEHQFRRLEGLRAGPLVQDHSHSEGTGLEHEAVVTPVSDAGGYLRSQMIYIGQLGLVLMVFPENSHLEGKVAQIFLDRSEGVCGNHMDGKITAQEGQPFGHPVQGAAIHGKRSVVIKDKMVKVEIPEAGNGNLDHGGFLSGTCCRLTVRDVDTIEKADKKINETVSVIIPTYNRAAWVFEAIDSVLSQTVAPLEIIVVDDGSTDGTRERLSFYGKRIVTVFQENRGVSAARNLGIRQSKGRFIAFLDSDDLWEKGKLACQLGFFRKNPEALICQTGEIWIRRGKRVNPMKKHTKLSGMIFGPSLRLCLVSPSAVMVKRTLFDEVGVFDETLPACEDYDLWLRIACRYPIFTTAENHVIKRGGHEDQLSAAPGLDRFRIQSLEKLLKSGRLSLDQKRETLGVLVEKCGIYAEGCRKRGRDEEADRIDRLKRFWAGTGP